MAEAFVVVAQPLDALRPAVGDAGDFVNEPVAASCRRQLVGGGHKSAEVRGAPAVGRNMQHATRGDRAAVQQRFDGALDFHGLAHPTRPAQHVEAARLEVVEHPRDVAEWGGVGLGQVGVLVRPSARIAPPAVGGG